MNQNILFSDRCEWDDKRQAVVFQAQQAGQLIDCIVSLGLLSQLDDINGNSGTVDQLTDFELHQVMGFALRVHRRF